MGYFQVDVTNIIQEVRPFTLQAWVQVKAAHLLLTVKQIQIKKKSNDASLILVYWLYMVFSVQKLCSATKVVNEQLVHGNPNVHGILSACLYNGIEFLRIQ